MACEGINCLGIAGLEAKVINSFVFGVDFGKQKLGIASSVGAFEYAIPVPFMIMKSINMYLENPIDDAWIIRMYDKFADPSR